MSYLERIKKCIVRYTPDERTALAAFQREAFGPDARQCDDDLFGWLFETNPYRPAEGPLVWVFRHDGRVVGQQSGIAFPLKVGRRCFRGSWAIDLIVNPEWRLRGVGPALSATHAAVNDVTAGTSASDAAYKACLRDGWIDVGRIRTYIRPLNAEAMLRTRRGPGPATWALGKAVQWTVRLVDTACDAGGRCSGAVLEPVDRFDARVDALWRQVRDQYPVLARRDLRALRWRFDALPAPGRYTRLYLTAGRHLQGYVVVRIGTWRGLPCGFIVDHLAGRRWLTPLLARCLEHLRARGAALASCATLSRWSQRRLLTLGFIPRRSGGRFIVRVTPDDPGLIRCVSDPANWFVTAADSDQDHKGYVAGPPA